jgi:hypothetical protein
VFDFEEIQFRIFLIHPSNCPFFYQPEWIPVRQWFLKPHETEVCSNVMVSTNKEIRGVQAPALPVGLRSAGRPLGSQFFGYTGTLDSPAS